MPSTSQFVLTGKRGSADRTRILLLVADQPRTDKQLADAMEWDCATVQSHLDVLQKNDLVDAREGDRTRYRPTPRARAAWETIKKAAKNLDRKQVKEPNQQLL